MRSSVATTRRRIFCTFLRKVKLYFSLYVAFFFKFQRVYNNFNDIGSICNTELLKKKINNTHISLRTTGDTFEKALL